jgi:flagellar protein FliS
MSPYQAYQDQTSTGLPRIELLLTIYDGAIDRLERAKAAVERNDDAAAQPLLSAAKAIVTGLASSVDLSYGELPMNFLRLYEFVLFSLGEGDAKHLGAALQTLRTLREGLEGIRGEAIQLERSGVIPALDGSALVHQTA